MCHPAPASGPYYLSNISTTWLQAQRFCRVRQGDLAAVRDLEELEELAGLVEDSSRAVSLGLRRQWGWSVSDGDDYREGEPAYWNWADDDQPSGEACGTLGPSGQWFSSGCDGLKPFFCYSGENSQILKVQL